MKHQFYQPEWFYVPYRIWQDPIGSRWKKMSISPSPASHCGHVRTSPYVPVPSHCLWRVSFVRQLLCEIYISNHHWKVLRKVKQDQICPLENWQFRYSANDYRKQYVRNIDNLRVNGRLRKLDASFIPKKKKKKKNGVTRSNSSVLCAFLKSWKVASCEFFWSSLSGTQGTSKEDPGTNESHIKERQVWTELMLTTGSKHWLRAFSMARAYPTLHSEEQPATVHL